MELKQADEWCNRANAQLTMMNEIKTYEQVAKLELVHAIQLDINELYKADEDLFNHYYYAQNIEFNIAINKLNITQAQGMVNVTKQFANKMENVMQRTKSFIARLESDFKLETGGDF